MEDSYNKIKEELNKVNVDVNEIDDEYEGLTGGGGGGDDER